METSKSPRKVLNAAYALATACLKPYASKFSRRDFTGPQLFACLVLREHQKKSYRGVVALLQDCPDWCADIGLKKVPDANTLCRAFHALVKPGLSEAMLDVSLQMARELQRKNKKKLVQGKPDLHDPEAGHKARTAALDSTMFEPHQVSRYFDKRRKQTECRKKHRPGDANRRRARTNQRMPKLSLAVQASSHLILAVVASIGMGSDHSQFAALLRGAGRRMALDTMLADKGYDSEANHCLARREMGIHSLIPARDVRPGAGDLTGHYRRLMRRRLRRGRDKEYYGQRWQVETVNSMIKRNLGSACRARSAWGRKKDLLLRVVTHNLMIVANL